MSAWDLHSPDVFLVFGIIFLLASVIIKLHLDIKVVLVRAQVILWEAAVGVGFGVGVVVVVVVDLDIVRYFLFVLP